MRRIITFIFLAIFVSCESDPSSPVDVPYILPVVKELAKNLTEKYGFRLRAIGGGQMNDIVHASLEFTVDAKYDVSQARELYITVMDRILTRINSDEKLRPFLHEYPFTHEYVSLSFNFHENNKPVPEEYIYLVFEANGVIFYEAQKPIGGGRFIDVHQEPVQEAYDIVMENGEAR